MGVGPVSAEPLYEPYCSISAPILRQEVKEDREHLPWPGHSGLASGQAIHQRLATHGGEALEV